ncbi:hypothetical protein KIL84_017749 [Mauremys mutica]|uniref:Uncharacterized protein n=1 Tax=Mauremys mutica TaxID=74926 RepID=A0A9D4AYX8_9SAUR|nr:hypothetical protein KIL84_017749 [Mauremys mutica]
MRILYLVFAVLLLVSLATPGYGQKKTCPGQCRPKCGKYEAPSKYTYASCKGATGHIRTHATVGVDMVSAVQFVKTLDLYLESEERVSSNAVQNCLEAWGVLKKPDPGCIKSTEINCVTFNPLLNEKL